MELKLVYRVLRKVSDWIVTGFYEDVYVEGQDNVPRDEPVIIVSTHHNEIFDIATLAVTIPHRRHLSFWAKSTLFANPILRTILLSSGAIPVRRNPNNGNAPSNNGLTASVKAAPPQSSLFRESSSALADDQVIGVFPEGTSYTQPSIVQVMPGAAWAAVEFARWAGEKKLGYEKVKELKIIPVGIVYTDKSHYQSRVCVRYGEPIFINSYTDGLFNVEVDVEVASRAAVKRITEEIERQMLRLTVNAPDWDTLYAATTARDILWGGEANILLKDWVAISQSLVNIFIDASFPTLSSNRHLEQAKVALTRYFALLHHTQIEHSALNLVFPLEFRHTPRAYSYAVPVLSSFSQLPVALFHLVFFAPPMILHFPAYIAGSLAGKYLAVKGEEETEAQFKVAGGAVGIVVGIGSALRVLWKMKWMDWAWVLAKAEGRFMNVKRVLMVLGAVYTSVYMLIKWHSMLVCGNYRRFRRLLTLYKLFVGLLSNEYASPEELDAYIRPPPPPRNPFIKGGGLEDEKSAHGQPLPGKLSSRSLIRPLLKARVEAVSALHAHLENLENGEQGEAVEFLRRKGARIPGFRP